MTKITDNEDNIAMLCHELRSPLTSIKGYLCALNDGVIPQDKQADCINTALDETNRMMEMIESFMTAAKVNAKNPILNTEIFDINELISDTISKKIDTKKSNKDCVVNIRRKFSSKTTNVIADKSLIREVITNLIDNAVKYGKKDGIANISASTDVNNGKVFICVSDSGNGINEEYLPLIWDKYFTTSATKHSIGMGLYLTKSIINAHGEKISVESKKGSGTAFTFTLAAANDL